MTAIKQFIKSHKIQNNDDNNKNNLLRKIHLNVNLKSMTFDKFFFLLFLDL